MKRLWCEFDCSPIQAEFIQPLDYKDVIVNKVTYNVLEMNWYFNPDTACQIFDSCRKVPEVAEVSSSAVGFLQFLADNSIVDGRTLFNMIYTQIPIKQFKPLTYEIAKCNNDSGTIFNFTNITSCPCSFCQDSCSSSNITIVFPSFFYGFSFSICIIAYSVLIFSILLIYIPKRILSSRKKLKIATEDEEKNPIDINNK